MATNPVVPGQISTHTHEGFTVSSNVESKEQIKSNFASQPKPKDGPASDPEQEEADRVKKAASELGKKGAEARKAKQDAALQAQSTTEEEEAPAEPEQEPEKKPEPEEERAAKPLGKPRDDPRARMLEATRKEAEAKRERDAAKAEAAAAKAERDALKAQVEANKAPVKAPERAGKPIATQFQTYDEFVEALADWKADQKVNEYKAKTEEEHKVKEYTRTIDEQLGKAVAARREYEKTDPTFMERLTDEVKNLIPSFARDPAEAIRADHVIADELILSGAIGPRLMLHLSDHPDDFQRIKALRTPQDVQVEMRLLARTLTPVAPVAAAPSKSEISKAKPPIKPVGGSSHVVEDEITDDMPFEEFTRKMNAREKLRRTGR